MPDILLTAAQSFDKLSHTNYEFTLSKNQKIIITSMSADKGDFAHIIGLDHLKDIWQFASHNTKIKGQIFRDILNGKYTFQNLSEATCHLDDIIPKTYNSATNNGYSVSERISKICRIDQLLDNAYNGAIYKWDKDKCKVKTQNGKERKMTINADYLLVIPSSSNERENIYVFAYQVNKGRNEPIKLSILSAFADCIDLTRGQERPYTILQEIKEDRHTNIRETLFIHPSYEKNKSAQSLKQNNNIKQIKFDNPTPQNILHNSSGTAAAVLPAPNPFKNLINGLKNLFKKQDKPAEATVTVESAEKTAVSETGAAVEKSPVSKEFTELIEARAAFAAENIPQAEYEQAVKKYMSSLHGKEMWTKAAEILRKQFEECPDNMKKYIGYELKNIEVNIEKKFPPQRQQTLDEIKRAAHEQYVKLQTENRAAEKEIPTVKNKSER